MIKEEIDRRKFLSISFKSVVSASATIMATKVSAYEQYLGEDSTNVDINSLGGSVDAPPPPHSSHSSRSWR
ncbi:hypothetical protein [Bathymodiolus azoricus thioautotrophic gill symbiont]|jgi:hypothetical protein|uniref:hypothetical protein n=2 Tax=sulfur-oxidizing symbionts TaxID=32036 RepID=UPI00192C533E|nr:hypothetical protein [Bathymodiolus azoricus thioautotrophic gill symbiont]